MERYITLNDKQVAFLGENAGHQVNHGDRIEIHSLAGLTSALRACVRMRIGIGKPSEPRAAAEPNSGSRGDAE